MKIEKALAFAEEYMKNADMAHDMNHIKRVWKMAKYLVKQEEKNIPINTTVVEISAIIHDIADPKVCTEDSTLMRRKILSFLESIQISTDDQNHIIYIIENLSFSKKNTFVQKSIEFCIVQDADRLDAIGAIGIARTFAYTQAMKRPIDNSEIPNEASAIGHFYEKLLLIKDLMNTKTAKQIAEKRHATMQRFLHDFEEEVNINSEDS